MLLLTVAASAGAYARTTVGPLQETMRVALALSDNQIALLQGPALAVPMVICAVPLGLVIDRYSRAYLLLFLAVLEITGNVLTALASRFAFLFGARCLIGLTAFAIAPVAMSLLADLYAPAQRGRATMVMALGQVGGVSAAFALGGALLAMADARLDGWRWVMFWMTGPLIAVLFAMLAMREPPRTERGTKNPSVRQAFTELWGYRAVIAPLLAGVVIEQISAGAALVWAAPALARNFGLAPARIGGIIGTAWLVSGAVGAIGGGLLADLCQRTGGPRRTMYALSALSLLSIPACLFALMPGTPSASVLLSLLISLGAVVAVTAAALSTVVIPNELRGLSMTVLAAAGLLVGLGLAPVSVSFLSNAIGGPSRIGEALALVGTAASVLSATVFAVGSRNLPGTATSPGTPT